MSATVTAVIPAYNAQQWIGNAIDSVLAQSYPSIETIVVDDGSTDGTTAVVSRYGDVVRHVRLSKSGVSTARNIGAKVGTGELIAFLDADDTWERRKVEVQVERFSARPDAVASFTGTRYVDQRRGTETSRTCRLESDLVRGLLLYSCIVGPPSALMVRRSVFENVGGFDPAFSQCADWDMWIRLAGVGPVDIVAEPLVRYRVHSENMSRNIRLLEDDTLRVLAKFFESDAHAVRYRAERRRIYSNQFLILSGSYLHAGSVVSSIRCLARGLVSYPPNLVRAAGVPWRLALRLSGRADSIQ